MGMTEEALLGIRELGGAGYGAWLVRTEDKKEEDDGRESGEVSE